MADTGDCPICARRVPVAVINEHIDSGCKLHCTAARRASSLRSEPATELDSHALSDDDDGGGEEEEQQQVNAPLPSEMASPAMHHNNRRSRASTTAKTQTMSLLQSPKQRHSAIKSASYTPPSYLMSHHGDDGEIVDRGDTDGQLMPGAIATPPEHNVAPPLPDSISLHIIRSAPLIPDEPRVVIERSNSAESVAWLDGELRPSHDLKIDLAANLQDAATQTANGQALFHYTEPDMDDFPIDLLPSHNLSPIDMFTFDTAGARQEDEDLFRPVVNAPPSAHAHGARHRSKSKSSPRKSVKAFEQTTLGRMKMKDVSKQELARISQELAQNGSQTAMNVQQTKQRQRIDFENRRAKLGFFRRQLYDLAKFVKKLHRKVAKKSGIWSSHLRYIESKFGSGIVSYFVLFRWIFLLDVALSFIWFTFIILFGIIGMSEDDSLGWRAFAHASTVTDASPTLYYGSSNFTVPRNVSANGVALFGGIFTGAAGYPVSFFFYGGYKRAVLSSTYNIDAAYLSVIAAFYLVSLVLIIRRIKKLFVSRPEVSGTINVDDVSPFGTTVFAAWDYAIMAKESRENHSFAVSTVFKTLLSRIEVKDKKVSISRDKAVRNALRRIVGHLFVLMTLAMAGLLVSTSFCIDNAANGKLAASTSGYCRSVVDRLTASSSLPQLGVSLSSFAISFFNLALPYLFGEIARYENYSDPEAAQNMTLARSFVLKMSSIYIILADFHFNERYKLPHWENAFGRQFYNLVWVNLGFTLVSTVAYGHLTKWIRGRAQYDFGLSNNILEVIYWQAIIWIGNIYAPMLIIVSILSGWVIFFVKKFTLDNCGLPPRRIYNSYTQNIYFQFFLLFTLGLMVMPMGWMLTQYPPSCGPFGPFAEPFGQAKALQSAYSIIPEAVSKFPEFARSVAGFVGSLAFVVLLVAVLGIWIYYLMAVGYKRQKRLKQLQYEVTIERADKRFLLRYYKVKT